MTESGLELRPPDVRLCLLHRVSDKVGDTLMEVRLG